MALRNGIYTFEKLSNCPSLFHAITTRNLPPVKTVSNGFIEENIRSITATLSIPRKRLLLPDQVHGANIAFVSAIRQVVIPETDGMIITGKSVFGGVATADCLSIILFDPKRQAIGLIHAGYKGLLADIISKTVQKMAEYGSTRQELIAGIGPGIGVCCYDVSEDRVGLFKQLLPGSDSFYLEKDGKYYLDIKRIASVQLEGSGIIQDNIETAPYCTVSDNNLFYSYRAEGADSGEFLTVAGRI